MNRPLTRRSAIDVAVVSLLSIIGIAGFETSFGGTAFLIAAVGGLVIGTGVGVLSARLRLNPLATVLLAIVGYFLFGTAIAIRSEGMAGFVPTVRSVVDLATGAVYGWTDVLTLQTPVGAPAYLAAVPYVCGWVVGLVSAVLAVRWLRRRTPTPARGAVLLAGPTALYVVGILIGTEQPYLAALRGIVFAGVALAWLASVRERGAATSAETRRALGRKRLSGIAIVVAGAVVLGGGAGLAVSPSSFSRFVLRQQITPPFDPLQYPSPLSAFRHYTNTVTGTDLFTVTGLHPGQSLRLATLDSYTGQVWNVVGTDVSRDGSGSYRLVGTDLPQDTSTSGTSERVSVIVHGYNDVWLPSLGDPQTLSLGGTASTLGQDLRYNTTTRSALLTNGLSSGDSYTFDTVVSATPSPRELAKLPVANVVLPAVPTAVVPDVVTEKATQFAGSATSPYQRLMNIQEGLKKGYLSHGTVASPSTAGHSAYRMKLLFTHTPLVGDGEQYASAFALMARSLGYPARVVMGFTPKVTSAVTPVTVTGKDVSAWDEVDFEGVGWVKFDPTPTNDSIPPVTPPQEQSVPLPQVRQPPRVNQPQNNVLSPVSISKGTKKHKKTDFVLPGWVYPTASGIGILLLLVLVPLAILAGVKARRRRRRLVGPADRRAAGAWDELVDRSRELGLRAPGGVTRLRQARELGVDEGLAQRVDRAVFGGMDASKTDVDTVWTDSFAATAQLTKKASRKARLFSRYRLSSRGAGAGSRPAPVDPTTDTATPTHSPQPRTAS